MQKRKIHTARNSARYYNSLSGFSYNPVKRKQYFILLIVLLIFSIMMLPFVAGAKPTPSPSPTASPTPTPTITPTPSPTPIASPSPTPTASPRKVQVKATFSSQGIIIPPGSNLVPIPSGWWIDRDGQTLDTSVTYNGMPSIRLDKTATTSNNLNRECDSITISVKPGNHIVFKCWMKTTASGLGDTNPYSGARIGIDFYDNMRISALQSPTYPNTAEGERQMYVNWGTSEWTLRTIDFILPSTMAADGYLGHPIGGSYTPTCIILWMQVWSSTYGATDSGKAWFANPQLYIYP